MKNIAIILFLTLLFTSCSSNNYFMCYSSDYLDAYNTPDTYSEVNYRIASGKQFIGKKIKKGYWISRYNGKDGYIYKPKDLVKKKIDSKYYDYISFNDEYGYYIDLTKYDNKNSKSSSEYNYTGGGSVAVKGYYRKDGTYVKSHTRKVPSKSRYKSSSKRR